MAKYYGEIGYVKLEETAPGVWREGPVIKKNYFGDTLEFSSRWTQNSEKKNDDLTITTRISILADPFALENFAYIKYATLLNQKWKVTAATPEYPRIILTLGGLYNGKV